MRLAPSFEVSDVYDSDALDPILAVTCDEDNKDQHNSNVGFRKSVSNLLKGNQQLISKLAKKTW